MTNSPEQKLIEDLTRSFHESYKPFITTYESIGGWKAVQMWWNPDHGGFWEPWQTGLGAYEKQEQAAEEAKIWAQGEELEYKS